MLKRILAVLVIAALSGFQFVQAQTNASKYKIANTFHLEGEGGWDCLSVDDATNRLFISHGTMVQVVDAKSGKLLGTISDTKGVHAIALAPDLNKGFTTNGKDTSVTVFDLKTLAVLTKVPVTGINPDVAVYDKFSQQVFICNGKSSNMTVIDAKTNKVTATIALDGKPEFPATNENGKVFVNIEDKNLINVIDVKTLKVEQKWPLAPGEEPSGLAIDAQNNRIFAGCNNKLMVILDAISGKIITTLPIGERVDGVAFDPGLRRVYSSNGEGTLTVVQEENKDTFKVLENAVTQKGARTLTLNAKTRHLYLPTAEFGPPPPATAENPKPRPAIKPGTFMILDVETLN